MAPTAPTGISEGTPELWRLRRLWRLQEFPRGPLELWRLRRLIRRCPTGAYGAYRRNYRIASLYGCLQLGTGSRCLIMGSLKLTVDLL